jgi:Lrp/AsnC family leucine-responsive transcriptional regulator
MDHIDVGIIRCLTKDARMNTSKISQQVNLSLSAVLERIKKMEASGLIRGYTAVIDERMAGFDVHAQISIRLEHPKYNAEFARQMLENPCVMECFYISGDFDYMARISAGSTKELTNVLNSIKEIPGVSRTRTYLIMDSIKQNTPIIPRLK